MPEYSPSTPSTGARADTGDLIGLHTDIDGAFSPAGTDASLKLIAG